MRSSTGAEPDYRVDDELITGEAVALDLRSASFVLRAAGSAIDVVLTLLVLLGGVLAVSSVGGIVDTAASQAILTSFVVFIVVVLPTAVETITKGRSLGKLVVGVRIVRDDGGSIGFRHAFIRALTALLEIYATLGGIAILVAMLGARSKRLGDLLSGTYSQNERVKRIPETLFVVPPELAGWANTADVARMPDRLTRRITQFLRQAGGMLPASRTILGTELAREVAPWISPIPDVDPEPLLQAVTAIRRERETAALGFERQRLEQLEPELLGLPHRFPSRG